MSDYLSDMLASKEIKTETLASLQSGKIPQDNGTAITDLSQDNIIIELDDDDLTQLETADHPLLDGGGIIPPHAFPIIDGGRLWCCKYDRLWQRVLC
jgi:hypothetical protein